ncbi:G2/mitotic-specific cyclin S13-7-like [Wolffia australiana]
MATRNGLQNQKISRPQAGGGLKQGPARRALGDIGNLVRPGGNARPVNDPKPAPAQISRPVTRNFRAHLRNGQPTADPPPAIAKNTKQPPARTAKLANPTAKNTKSPHTVIEISPDPGESLKKSKKKVNTLTSVLSARSKLACGISDIDAEDRGNELAVTDYVEEIYTFYKMAENWYRPGDYMDSQTALNAKMRAILADWLIDVHFRFELMPETLFLAFHIIDRYLTLETVPRRELQLVGVAALLIACKYEEIWAPEIDDFICIADKAYSRDQILAKEKRILDKLEWNLTVPTPYVFLVRFLKAATADQELERMVFFLAELGLMQYSMIRYTPSMLAASAVYAARCTLNRLPLWSETLEQHSGYSEQDLTDSARLLAGFHASATESKLKVVFKKYSNPDLGAVAMHRPALRLLEGFEDVLF